MQIQGRVSCSMLIVFLPGLIAHSTTEEEGVRNMVAECLGALTSIHDSVMIPLLQQMATKADNVNGRWTAATSIRYLFPDIHRLHYFVDQGPWRSY